jgi:AraC-like DNA-binding protein
MPVLGLRKGAGLLGVRSPQLHLAAARRKEFATHPRISGDASCPYRLVAGGFNFDAGRSVFPEYLASIDELVIWRYVVAGSLLWESGQQQVRLDPGMVLATHQPSAARLVVAAEGVSVLWILFRGLPVREYFDQITARFGPVHALAPMSAPVRLAEELVRAVRGNRPRSPFFWSEHVYRFLSAWHQHLDQHRPPLHRLLAMAPKALRLLPSVPRTVKSFARQLGYSPSYLTRQIAKRWKDTPGRLLREIRLGDAAHRLIHSADSVQGIAARAGYASVPAFITAFKRAHGRTPLAYRHEHR